MCAISYIYIGVSAGVSAVCIGGAAVNENCTDYICTSFIRT